MSSNEAHHIIISTMSYVALCVALVTVFVQGPIPQVLRGVLLPTHSCSPTWRSVFFQFLQMSLCPHNTHPTLHFVCQSMYLYLIPSHCGGNKSGDNRYYYTSSITFYTSAFLLELTKHGEKDRNVQTFEASKAYILIITMLFVFCGILLYIRLHYIH